MFCFLPSLLENPLGTPASFHSRLHGKPLLLWALKCIWRAFPALFNSRPKKKNYSAHSRPPVADAWGFWGVWDVTLMLVLVNKSSTRPGLDPLQLSVQWLTSACIHSSNTASRCWVQMVPCLHYYEALKNKQEEDLEKCSIPQGVAEGSTSQYTRAL